MDVPNLRRICAICGSPCLEPPFLRAAASKPLSRQAADCARVPMDACKQHSGHGHHHAHGCGHYEVLHDGHKDHLHDGHLHHQHGDHVDDHVLLVAHSHPDACTPGHE